MSHSYVSTLAWRGNTLAPDYPRTAEARNPGGALIPVSSSPAAGGDPSIMNPEELLAAALATCHMLFFLSLAQKARLEVKAYDDAAEAVLETVDKVSRVKVITLRPVIRVTLGTSAAKVLEMFQKAHKYCIIANSVSCDVLMEPRVVEG